MDNTVNSINAVNRHGVKQRFAVGARIAVSGDHCPDFSVTITRIESLFTFHHPIRLYYVDRIGMEGWTVPKDCVVLYYTDSQGNTVTAPRHAVDEITTSNCHGVMQTFRVGDAVVSLCNAVPDVVITRIEEGEHLWCGTRFRLYYRRDGKDCWLAPSECEVVFTKPSLQEAKDSSPPFRITDVDSFDAFLRTHGLTFVTSTEGEDVTSALAYPPNTNLVLQALDANGKMVYNAIRMIHPKHYSRKDILILFSQMFRWDGITTLKVGPHLHHMLFDIAPVPTTNSNPNPPMKYVPIAPQNAVFAFQFTDAMHDAVSKDSWDLTNPLVVAFRGVARELEFRQSHPSRRPRYILVDSSEEDDYVCAFFNKGDWVIRRDNGDLDVFQDGEFQKQYRALT